MKRIRVGQIGIGHDHAFPIYKSVRRLSDEYELVGIAIEEPSEGELSNPSARPLECYADTPVYTIDELLSMELDAVIVETNDVNSTRHAIRALERGVPVHMDKPGGTSLADFEHMVALAKEKHLPLSLGYMYRFNPAVREALAAVRAGEIGEITRVEAYMNCWHTAEKRAWLSQLPGGMLFFLGCHMLDLALMFRGIPDEILPLSSASGLEGVTAEDNGFAVLKYKNGISMIGSSAVEHAGFRRRQLIIVGSKGTIELHPLEAYGTPSPDAPERDMYTSWRKNLAEDTKAGWNWIAPFSDTALMNRYDPMMRAFASYVRGDAENPFTPDYELALYRCLLRACGSIQ